MSWLARLKNLNMPAAGTDRTDTTPENEVSSVLSVAPPAVSENLRGRPVVHFRLPEHPPGAWATVIGKPGQSRDALVADLRRRWPEVEVAHDRPPGS